MTFPSSGNMQDMMSTTKPISDPIASRKPSKDFLWWIENIDHKITPELRQLLETYSNVRPEDVSKHVYAIREKAWAIRPYPCTGIGAFLSPSISQHPAYATLLPRLKAGGKFLDIGCYMGQDLRRLTQDGVPQGNIIGNDIVNHWDLGYGFFNDRDRFHVPYVESDLLFPNDEMKGLYGKIDIISIVHVLHQWDWDTQVLACKELSKYSRPGSVVIGYQGGTNDIAKRTQLNMESGHPEFTLHDVETFERMWKVVCEETGTKWNSEATIVPWNELAYRDEEVAYIGSDFALLRFLVTRIN